MEKIIELAIKSKDIAYAPYSRFKVGACIEGDNGKLYCGCNIESVSYSPTICAERSAISHAVMDGCTKFKRVAIANSGNGFSWPCGVCRQLLSEFGYKDIEIIVVNKNGDTDKQMLSSLLPEAFVEIPK